MVKIILISVICGISAFLICKYFNSALGSSGRASDPIGSGLAALFQLALCTFIGAATFVIVLVLQLKGAKMMTTVWVSLIPVVLYSSITLLSHYYREKSWRTFDKLIEETNAPLVNPWETTDKEVLLARLQAGEKIDKTNEKGQTLLHYAAYIGDLDLMKFAVENGADVNKKDNRGLSAAHYAVFSDWTLLEYLADNGIDLTTITINMDPLIIYAVHNKGADDISMLIKHGVSANTLSAWGSTPLFTAATVETARVLIDAGADVNFKSKNGLLPTPVFEYRHGNDLDILKLLIEAGADIEVRNEYGNTPFLETVSYAREAALILLDSGADIHVKNNENNTPLLLVARACGSVAGANASKDIEWLKILVERGADKNAIGSMGQTAYEMVLDKGFEAKDIEFLKPYK